MSTFSENLNKAADKIGLPERGRKAYLYKKLLEQADFKVSAPGVRKWFEGDSIPNSRDKIEAIAKAMETTPDFLLTGKGANDNNIKSAIKTKTIPVLNYVQAGNFTTIEAVDAIEKFEVPIKDIPDHNEYFLIKVEGNSMYNPSDKKSLSDGDIILVDTTKQSTTGNIVIAKNGEHEATIKKLDGDPFMPVLVPLNPDFKKYDEYNLKGKDCTIIGVAIKVYSIREL